MKTLYAACLSRLCMSQADAALFHNVALSSIKRWCARPGLVPQGIWDELRALDIDARLEPPPDDLAALIADVDAVLRAPLGALASNIMLEKIIFED